MTLGNTFTESNLSVNSTLSDRISDNYDTDWHRIYLEAGRTYQFDLTAGGIGTPILTLRRGSGSVIEFQDADGWRSQVQMTYTAPSSGFYYLDVASEYWSGFTYNLSAGQLGGGTPNGPGNSGSTTWPDSWNETGNGGFNNSGINIDNSIRNTVNQIFNITVNGDNNNVGSLGNNTFSQSGTQGNDRLEGNFSRPAPDALEGGEGDDELIGYRGADILIGGAGFDILRGGNGRDVLSGGIGQDQLFGGFGQNTFTGEQDGWRDRLYIKSDEYAYNWIYDKAGNQDGEKVDIIGPLDTIDAIVIQGVEDDELSFRETIATVRGMEVSGIGIFAKDTLEAIYVGGNFEPFNLENITYGNELPEALQLA